MSDLGNSGTREWRQDLDGFVLRGECVPEVDGGGTEFSEPATSFIAVTEGPPLEDGYVSLVRRDRSRLTVVGSREHWSDLLWGEVEEAKR